MKTPALGPASAFADMHVHGIAAVLAALLRQSASKAEEEVRTRGMFAAMAVSMG